MHATFADTIDALGPAWFTEILDGAVVEAIAVEPLAAAGAVSDLARVRLTYASGDGPASVVAKAPGTTELQQTMEAALGLFDRERHFYGELAEHTPVRTPQCFHTGGDGTPLLIEDLGAARLRDQVTGIESADAVALMDELSRLHAAFWNQPDRLGTAWAISLTSPEWGGTLAQIIATGLPAFEDRHADRVAGTTMDGVRRVVARFDEVLRGCDGGPVTLVHNDCRLDNLFFAEDGSIVFIDWQIATIARGVHDVVFVLAGSVPSDELEASWEPLLRRWHDGLAAHGVWDYDWAACREHYRAHLLYAFAPTLALFGALQIAGDEERALADVWIQRILRHAEALDAFALLA